MMTPLPGRRNSRTGRIGDAARLPAPGLRIPHADGPSNLWSSMAFLEDFIDDDKAWNVVALASATLAGIAVRNLLETTWEAFKGDEPPQNPAARSVDWGEALAWTVATGVAVGVGRLLAQRGAAAGWKSVRGHYPKGLD